MVRWCLSTLGDELVILCCWLVKGGGASILVQGYLACGEGVLVLILDAVWTVSRV